MSSKQEKVWVDRIVVITLVLFLFLTLLLSFGVLPPKENETAWGSIFGPTETSNSTDNTNDDARLNHNSNVQNRPSSRTNK